jgi:methionyl-tRNA synthetase
LDNFYTAYLANGLGNTASRLAKLAGEGAWELRRPEGLSVGVKEKMMEFKTHQAAIVIIEKVGEVDKQLSVSKPWLIKEEKEKRRVLKPLLEKLMEAAFDLQIFMPETAERLLKHFSGGKIGALVPLCPRLK